jgi:hypothetical protein
MLQPTLLLSFAPSSTNTNTTPLPFSFAIPLNKGKSCRAEVIVSRGITLPLYAAIPLSGTSSGKKKPESFVIQSTQLLSVWFCYFGQHRRPCLPPRVDQILNHLQTLTSRRPPVTFKGIQESCYLAAFMRKSLCNHVLLTGCLTISYCESQ